MLDRARFWYRAALPDLEDEEARRVSQWLVGHERESKENAPASAASSSVAEARSVSAESHSTTVPPDASSADSVGDRVIPASTTEVLADGAALSTEAVPQDRTFFETTLDDLAKIDASRRTLLEELKTYLARRHVELPREYVKAQNEVARLTRMAEAVQAEQQSIEVQASVLEGQRSAADRPQRASMDQQLTSLRQRFDTASLRLTALANDAKPFQEAVKSMEVEMAALDQQIETMLSDGRKLTLNAFWTIEPSGSLADDQYGQIVDVMTEWLGDDQSQYEVVALRALAFARANRLDEAWADAQRLVRNRNPSPMSATVFAYVRSLRNDSINRDLTRIIQQSADFSAAYLLRGLLYRKMGRHQSAIEDLEKLAVLAPESPWPYCHLALLLACTPNDELRDPSLALRYGGLAAQYSFEKSWMCLDAKAAALAAVGRFDEAVAVETTAHDLAPTQHKPVCLRRLALYEAKQPLILSAGD